MIYVVTHKDIDLLLPNNYSLIGVGNNKIASENMHDDVGDNISQKNQYYCELTALYWIWKNATNIDVVGLTHYRRIFSCEKIDDVSFVENNEVNDLLDLYDIILPPLYDNGNKTVYEHYCYAHKRDDIDRIRVILMSIYPEYIKSFDYIMNQNYEYGFNMFISKISLCNEYCTWLFDILKIFENTISIDDYDEYQKRVFGFLAERLFTVWIYHHKLKIKELVILDPKKQEIELKAKKLTKANRKPISLY